MRFFRIHPVLLLANSSIHTHTCKRALSKMSADATAASPTSSWIPGDRDQEREAKEKLEIWPLDEHNAALLNEVHPYNYVQSTETPHEIYDLIAIGAGAGGLVSSKQSARRGAKSAIISAHLAGGDCLNVGCVPSKGLLSVAKAVSQIRRASEYGIDLPGGYQVDFPKVMERMRRLRTKISPADGHAGTSQTGAHVYQGFGKFTGPDTIEVHHSNGDKTTLRFQKAVIATGGRPSVPSVPGLSEAPYSTNEILFNLEVLPPRMIVLGSGVVALEMAQSFALLGSDVTILMRNEHFLKSKQGDDEAAQVLRAELEKSGVKFITGVTKQVETIRQRVDDPKQLPLMVVTVGGVDSEEDLRFECECLLVATGRVANVENLGLEGAGVQYKANEGIQVNDLAQTIGNPNIYAVGDCVAGVPRLTHVSGEMAKLVVQNSLFDDHWKLSSLIVPAVMYTEPEYATVGVHSVSAAEKAGIQVDTYRGGLEHNDRAILEGTNVGFCKVFCRKGTDEIVGATIVAERAGEMINEISLAMKNNIGLKAIGRNIHAYPTTGEAVMGCGIQYINSHWARLD